MDLMMKLEIWCDANGIDKKVLTHRTVAAGIEDNDAVDTLRAIQRYGVPDPEQRMEDITSAKAQLAFVELFPGVLNRLLLSVTVMLVIAGMAFGLWAISVLNGDDKMPVPATNFQCRTALKSNPNCCNPNVDVLECF